MALRDIRRRPGKLEAASRSANGFAVIPLSWPWTEQEEEAAIDAWCAEHDRPRPALVILIKRFCFDRMDQEAA